MGKKKQKNKKNSELRVIFFIILISAVLFIISTYAWFSTQKDVSITNLEGTVEVAEGLEISLDALNWSNEIVLGKDMNIIDNAYNLTNYKHRNISPSEMLPVSTVGLLPKDDMIDLPMLRGKITNSKKLTDIVVTSETETDSEDAAYPGYFAFDVFLKNSSKQDDRDDNLQINKNSSLQIIESGNDQVGLQNTVRVAFAKYGTGEILAQDQNGNVTSRSGVSDVMASQETILRETGTGANDAGVYLTDVAIWEPNSNDHIEYIVNNNNMITWASGSANEKAYATKTLSNGKKGFDLTTQLPTFALKNSAASTGNVIEDIYLWDGTETNLQEQLTLKTTKKSTTDYTVKEGVEDLFSASNKDVPFSIAPNSVVRLRIYVWLEGQDVDCINYASHGGGIVLNIGLIKGEDAEADDPA